MKNRVVMFCTIPLVAPSQKNTCFDPSGHLKNGKCIFYVKTGKTLVAKVVGNAKMDISTKNGTMVPKLICYGTCTNHAHLPRKTKRTPAWKHLSVRESTCEPLGWHVWYFS
jgi:hypothetical protein